uniref:Capsule assembly Wzi family protein n=1 Tax=Prevotella sp. GTC17259 TaxID=3236795 RepID=A0AB33J0B8_9BACT
MKHMTTKPYACLVLTALFALPASARAWDDEVGVLKPFEQLGYQVEMQTSFSKGRTPLWLNANKYGLSSLDRENGYLRMGVMRPLRTDSVRRWGLGYGLDVAVPWRYTSHLVVQQAFAEVRWLHGLLTVGSKQEPMQLRNNALSSGSQTLGINARPVPQVRLSLPEYWILPLTDGWLRIKGHVAYGRMTDDGWQHDFTKKRSRYADDVLYHSKAGYLMIGNPDRFMPLSLELGLEMAATFGGTSHIMQDDGTLATVKSSSGPKSFWKAFIPGGAETIEQGTVYQNAEGNQLGSWMARLNYDATDWRFSIYADKYFEDHSSMFQLDYDGYGTGEDWNVRRQRRYLLYDFQDVMLGAELQLKRGWWLHTIVLEYLNTRYQSGPVYHDHTQSISDHIGGIDNYYNHHVYTGWQHWGQVIGNPLYLSPIYNADGKIEVKDNRFRALHLGLSGSPTDNIDYRILGTYQACLGTYAHPYTVRRSNVSMLAEVSARLRKGWLVRGSYGMDIGSVRGHNYGLQLTVAKRGLFKLGGGR